MKLFLNLAVAALVSTAAMAQTVRVGTFHKPSIVTAYYRSQMWADTLKSKLAEMQVARNTNDTKKAAELDGWGEAHQELAHRQLAGDAPIANILEALSPGLAEIAQKARVVMVVGELPYADATVETVDVTDLLLDWLKADERTRAIVRDLRSHVSPSPGVH